MKSGIIPFREVLDQYGDMSFRDFVEEAIKHGLIPLQLQLTADELEAHPQRDVRPILSAQGGLITLAP